MISNSKHFIHVNRNFQQVLLQTFARKVSANKYSTSFAEVCSSTLATKLVKSLIIIYLQD